MSEYKSLSPAIRAIDILDQDTLIAGTAGCEIIMINATEGG